MPKSNCSNPDGVFILVQWNLSKETGFVRLKMQNLGLSVASSLQILFILPPTSDHLSYKTAFMGGLLRI